ncbi:hypothetical protein Bca52824_022762 [Brassica carinata]|uniref:Uncharacterized protein n=1 Tax=Brassica carinata TaxID=52824 RepID=A0A8X7VHP9_BRACI|nr:hypothetical protein Bca52824_022762 [Brassica carinata]
MKLLRCPHKAGAAGPKSEAAGARLKPVYWPPGRKPPGQPAHSAMPPKPARPASRLKSEYAKATRCPAAGRQVGAAASGQFCPAVASPPSRKVSAKQPVAPLSLLKGPLWDIDKDGLRFYGRLIVDLGQSGHGFQGTKMLSLRDHETIAWAGRGPSPLAPDGSGRAFVLLFPSAARSPHIFEAAHTSFAHSKATSDVRAAGFSTEAVPGGRTVGESESFLLSCRLFPG